MAYKVVCSIEGLPPSESAPEEDIAISSPLPPWVVTVDGKLGEQLRQVEVGSSGSISEMKNGRTVDHSVKLRSLEDLGNGRVRATYDPAS